MRKNNFGGKKLKKLYYTVYRVRGLNLDRLIGTLKKRGINLYDVKKKGQKTLILTVNGSDNEKFFAITNELCYNIKKIRDKGKFYPALYLFRNLGLVVGGIIVITLCILSDDRIFSVNYSGSGSIYKREVAEFLDEKGITFMSKFSDLDLKSLEDEIVAYSPHLSFASCQKVGNRLEINLVLATDGKGVLSGNETKVVAEVDGVIESIKVYRGTALFQVGDTVKKGDVLVGGFAVVGDNTVDINVLACVTLITEETHVYRTDKDDAEDVAILLAKENTEKETVRETVLKQAEGEEFIYTVKLYCRYVQYVG